MIIEKATFTSNELENIGTIKTELQKKMKNDMSIYFSNVSSLERKYIAKKIIIELIEQMELI